MFCRYCGVENDESSVFCKSCGKRMFTESNNNIEPEEESKLPLIIGIIVAVVVIVLALIVVVWLLKDKDEDIISQQPSTNVSVNKTQEPSETIKSNTNTDDNKAEDEEDIDKKAIDYEADKSDLDIEDTDVFAKYCGRYQGDSLIIGNEGNVLTIHMDISGNESVGKSSVGTAYIAGYTGEDETVNLYIEGTNIELENEIYDDVFYFDNHEGAKLFLGFFKDGEEFTLDYYFVRDDGSQLLIARLDSIE